MIDHPYRESEIRESFRDALVIFRQHGGILKTGQAHKLGVDTRIVADMYAAGLLDKLSRGVYRLAELPPLDYPDLVVVALRAPQAVICLISALAFYEMTTEVPRQIHIALPQSVHPPKLANPPLDVVWLSPESYAAGIETHELDGVPVQIYSPAKTVADCFKFRNKIGKEIAIAALQDYLARPGSSIDELLGMALANRVDKVMSPYLEAIVA